MNNLCVEKLKEKIYKTGFQWEKSIKNVENLLESIKMNINNTIKKKKELNNKVANEKKKKLPVNEIEEKNNSRILIIPSQIINFDIEDDFELIKDNTNNSNDCYYTSDSSKYNELSIFDEKKINNTEVYYKNSNNVHSLIIQNTIRSQKSPTVRTSSSITFLSRTIAVKKRRLIVPPISGRKIRKKNQDQGLENKIRTINPKRKLKLKGENYTREYRVYRDEDYGIIDNTDDIIIESDHIHRQDDDRQTTSEVQEWAIELIRRYLRETETLFENKDNQSFEKSERIRSLRQRFGFYTKVR